MVFNNFWEVLRVPSLECAETWELADDAFRTVITMYLIEFHQKSRICSF